MKNYLVIISISIIFLVPTQVPTLSGTFDDEEQFDKSTDYGYIPIEWQQDEGLPYVSSYLTVRNSNDVLVGALHFTTPISKENIVFSPTFVIPVRENLIIEEVCNRSTGACVPTQFQVSKPSQTKDFIDIDCNNMDNHTKIPGYGDIYDTCFFYTFGTGYTPLLTNPETGESTRLTLWSSLHHGYISEDGDTVNIDWTVIFPKGLKD